MKNDEAVIKLCIRTCNRIDKTAPRIIRIRNTLALSEFEISEALIPAMKENMEIIEGPYNLPFNEAGALL